HELKPGEAIDVGPLRVEGVPAAHDGHRWPHGPCSEAIGYMVDGGPRVYFAGDTALFDGMRDLDRSLDLAPVPIWGWGPRRGPGHTRIRNQPSRAARASAASRRARRERPRRRPAVRRGRRAATDGG